LDWSRGRQLALRGLTKTLQQISGVGEQGAADLLQVQALLRKGS
jgi:hypothetical protein